MTSFTLHIFAMICMFMDHAYKTMLYTETWFTYVGRLAFPIFAYMIVEGWLHTSNRIKYIKRMAIWALISEIPFDLMVSGNIINVSHQNVMFTFLISLICLYLIEKAIKCKENIGYLYILLIVACGYMVGDLACVDYAGNGVLTVLLFRINTGNKNLDIALKALALFIVHWLFIGGVEATFGWLVFPIQGLAVLALIPIGIYAIDREQGYYSKVVKYIYYAFYPLHMLLLYALYLIR